MIKFQKRPGDDPDFAGLVSHLDAYLAEKDGRERDFYNQYNGISIIKYAIGLS